ncbi:DUF4158 domain-containing protein [Streptosporangium canum]|uniref:DUF4158 domain-containing protein n=1 Tax=Streptosporangium canum TaxID=324952 RepID=UPI00343A9D16
MPAGRSDRASRIREHHRHGDGPHPAPPPRPSSNLTLFRWDGNTTRRSPSRLTERSMYGDRPQIPDEHAAQIRALLGYREFAEAEGEVATFIASRVRKSRDSRRELFDRAVVWLIDSNFAGLDSAGRTSSCGR